MLLSQRQLTLTSQTLNNGMVFVWGSKNNIGELLDRFAEMGYDYAENFIFVLLSRKKIPSKPKLQRLDGNQSLLNFFSKAPAKEAKKEVAESREQKDYETGRVDNPAEVFLNEESEYFRESQKVLYMFRKSGKRGGKKEELELRHQRTSDVFFTIGDDGRLDWRAKETVYGMIETLLPQARYNPKQPLRLMELWGEPGHHRQGWINVCEVENPKE